MNTLQDLIRCQSATSTELVQLLDSFRSADQPQIRLDHFKRKAISVLGDIEPYREGRTYRFPRREACLLVMSYSYDLQAAIYDLLAAKRR